MKSHNKEYAGCNDNFKELAYDLNKNGYQLARREGSHFTFKNASTGKIITANKMLNKMVKQRLKKEM